MSKIVTKGKTDPSHYEREWVMIVMATRKASENTDSTWTRTGPKTTLKKTKTILLSQFVTNAKKKSQKCATNYWQLVSTKYSHINQRHHCHLFGLGLGWMANQQTNNCFSQVAEQTPEDKHLLSSRAASNTPSVPAADGRHRRLLQHTTPLEVATCAAVTESWDQYFSQTHTQPPLTVCDGSQLPEGGRRIRGPWSR